MARKRKRRRDRSRFSRLYAVVSFFLIGAAVVVGGLVFFRVDTVEVRGNAHYDSQEIIAVSGIETGDNLYSLNKYRIANNLLTQLPYIQTVSIHRNLPSTVTITVTETQTTVAVESEGKYWAIDENGKVLEQLDSSEGLVLVTGLTPETPEIGQMLTVDESRRLRLQSLTALLTALRDRGALSAVDRFQLESDSKLLMEYDGRLTVQMRLADDYDYQVRRLLGILERIEPDEGGLLDLTQEDKAYLR